MKPPTRLLYSCLIAICLVFAAAAQSTKGTIAGRVLDSSGAILLKAEIQLQPQGMTMASDEKGEFTITDLAPGNYHVEISYVGFDPFEKDVTVAAGEIAQVEAHLEVHSKDEGVLVTAERPRGEAEAINRTRMADNILQTLPAEIITSLPNANVADALARLPSITLERTEGEGEYIQVRGTEPRLTNVTIDGITIPSPEPTIRQIRLDVIPADLVESVEVNKTLQPDIDGDGIGGSVNLKTKTAGEFPTITLYGIGGYNKILSGRYNDQMGATLGHRLGVQHKFGILFGATKDYNGRGIDNEQPAIDTTQSTFAHPFYDDNTIREYRYYRNRWGYAGTVDYKISSFSSIYLKGLYSNLQDYGDKWYYEPVYNGSPKFYTSSKRPDASIANFVLGGHHAFSGSMFTWALSASRSYEKDSAGNPKADFSWTGPALTCGYNPLTQTDPNVPHFGSNCDGTGTPLQNANDWGFKDITIPTGMSAQLNLSASAGFSKNYRIGSHYGLFEVGGKIRNGHKFQNSTESVYDGWKAASYPMTMFQGSFSSNNFFNDDYFGGHFGPVSDFNQLSTYTLASLPQYLDGYKTASDTYPNIFDIVERITAGYMMDTMDFGKLHMVAGVRFEGTQMDTLGYNVTLYAAGSKNCVLATGCGVPVPVTNNPSYVDILPSLSFRYSLDSESGIRLVYGRGVSRPDPYQLVPYVTEDDSTNPATVTIGNPSLKPEHANNYDLLYERYLNPAGIFQAGFFAKQISGALISTTYPGNLAAYPGDTVTQWINASNGEIHGFEASYQQRLSMLPGVLKGFGMFANISLSGSKISHIPGRSDSPTMQRQAPTSWNLSPTYDRGRFSARVGWAYAGASIYQYQYQSASDPTALGPTGPSGDVYTLPHLQLDAQFSYRLAYGWTAEMYGLNLTDEVFGYYTGSPIFVNQREYYKATIAMGVRYNLNRER
jgi:TonB-dependent receptor